MKNISRNVMNSIKMDRIKLLRIVQDNKVKHVKEFLESVDDYKKLVLQIAQLNIKFAETSDLNEFKKMKEFPAAPKSYEDSYSRAIRMLELSVDDIIEVEEEIFNQLVLDEWTWKRNFTISNAMYKSSAF